MTTKFSIFFNVAQGLNSWSFWSIASHLLCSILGMPRDGFILMHMDMPYCILTIAFEFHLHSSTCICIWLLLWFHVYNHGFIINLVIFMSIRQIVHIAYLQIYATLCILGVFSSSWDLVCLCHLFYHFEPCLTRSLLSTW